MDVCLCVNMFLCMFASTCRVCGHASFYFYGEFQEQPKPASLKWVNLFLSKCRWLNNIIYLKVSLFFEFL